MSPRRKPNKPIDIYVRVSQVRGREGDSFISPDLQEERCRAQLVADGLEAGQVFTDLDESGGKESRPAYDQALARIESGESGGVAVYKLSRFGRRVRNVLKDIAWIEEQGGTFLCVDPKIDTSTAAGRFMLTVFAALDELELDNHAAAWGEAQRRALARGAFTAQTPWGYTRNGGGQLVPDKQTARRVKQMFRKRGEGMSIANLGRWLAAEGIRSPTGGEAWSHSTIAQVLRNRIYLGEQRHGELVNTEAHKALVSRASGKLPRWPSRCGRASRRPILRAPSSPVSRVAPAAATR
jgi:DNA invertase Pin-like site-specific DNA recombinase